MNTMLRVTLRQIAQVTLPMVLLVTTIATAYASSSASADVRDETALRRVPTRPTPFRAPARSSPADTRIELYVEPRLPDVWTAVEWKGLEDSWHLVESWQSTYNHLDLVAWHVRQGDYGRGPFRWVIYQYRDGPILSVSDPFYLPTFDNDVIRVSVKLP